MTSRTLLEGWLPLLLAIALAVGGWMMAGNWGALPGGLLLFGVLWFFRDPARRPPEDPAAIVAPADGLVMEIDEVGEASAIGGRGRRISIFLSVFDVHVNRAPAAGVIRSSEYRSGSFLDARRRESCDRNERRDWVILTDRGACAVSQIAGLIARRIVAWSKPGERVATGERIGMIRFGSRTDLVLPEAVDVAVRIGERVRGGETVVARWRSKTGEAP